MAYARPLHSTEVSRVRIGAEHGAAASPHRQSAGGVDELRAAAAVVRRGRDLRRGLPPDGRHELAEVGGLPRLPRRRLWEGTVPRAGGGSCGRPRRSGGAPAAICCGWRRRVAPAWRRRSSSPASCPPGSSTRSCARYRPVCVRLHRTPIDAFISYEKARMTGTWRSVDTTGLRPRISARDFGFWKWKQQNFYQMAGYLMARNGIAPVDIAYEDFYGDGGDGRAPAGASWRRRASTSGGSDRAGPLVRQDLARDRGGEGRELGRLRRRLLPPRPGGRADILALRRVAGGALGAVAGGAGGAAREPCGGSPPDLSVGAEAGVLRA